MAGTVNFQDIVKNLVHGTIDQNLCLICLMPLNEFCENVFTKICREDQEFSVAQVLGTVCQIQISESENYNVCSDCFIMAYEAYKFFILAKRSSGILNYYIEELETNIYSVESIENMKHDSICITLPEIAVNTYVELDVQAYLQRTQHQFVLEEEVIEEDKVLVDEDGKYDNKLIVVVEENGKPTYYKFTGSTSSVDEDVEVEKPKIQNATTKEKSSKRKVEKVRKKREPMETKKCSQCPIQYRFLNKLKFHMKMEHNIDLYVCKICKEVTEDLDEYNSHLSCHTDVLQCNICETIFKKQETLITHMRMHDEKEQSDKVHVCELCGTILPDEDQLKMHYDKKHSKKYTCYYCGRMYKVELAFDAHIKKHEMLEKSSRKNKDPADSSKVKSSGDKQRWMCSTCGRDFVDERSLIWHSRLHTNERPYACQVCGKTFVSLNRRNQHAMCAHTAPTKRCPLCPALFHLRSMVNTHIKRVHLHSHKRRARSSKHRNAWWTSRPVPIQELSVDVQADLLDLQDDQQDSQVAQQNIKEDRQDLSADQHNLRIGRRRLVVKVEHDEVNDDPDDDWEPLAIK